MEQMTDLENELIDKTKEYLRRVDSGDIAIPDTLTYDAYGIYLDGIKKRFDEEDDVPITHGDLKLLFELSITGSEKVTLGMKTSEEHLSTCLAAVKESALRLEDQEKIEKLLKEDSRSIGVVENSVGRLYQPALYDGTQNSATKTEKLRELMKSIVDVYSSTGNDVYQKAQVFPSIDANNKINDLGLITISRLLHCTSPECFPLCDGNDSSKFFFTALDIHYPSNEKAYLDFAEKTRNLLHENYPTIRNLRVLDCAAREDDIARLINEINETRKGEKTAVDTSDKENTSTDSSGQDPSLSLNTILYGPPGTGKTYSTVKYAVKICDLQYYEENKGEYDQLFDRYEELVDEGRIVFTTFHQSFGYEDFIEGIRPVLDSEDGVLRYKRHDGIFKTLCDEAKKNENENDNFVIIIDEINRGNVARIFGELITLLEDSKRLGREEERQAILPYSAGESFGVPQNVYVLGTMNTADRSLTQLDTALRRRFDFVEVAPDSSLLKGKGNDFGIELDSLLEEMNERIERLYDREHKIGHSYFLKVESFDDLKTAFEKRIIPLLQEYFYDDYDKIRQVLSDKFVSDKGDGKSYELVSSTEWVPEHFVEIYNPSNNDESAEAE